MSAEEVAVMEIKWQKSPNYRVGANRRILAIANHITAGLMPGCLSWMCNPASKASAHYLVCKNGEIYQLVADTDIAWHAGVVKRPTWALYDGTNPNRYTIGIEHECVSGGELTETQYQATLQLHKELIRKHKIPLDRQHIIGHCEIDSVNRPNCPGPLFPWARLMTDLGKAQQDTLTVSVHGYEEQVPVVKREGSNYIPIRWLERLGYKIDWDGDKVIVAYK